VLTGAAVLRTVSVDDGKAAGGVGRSTTGVVAGVVLVVTLGLVDIRPVGESELPVVAPMLEDPVDGVELVDGLPMPVE
jgi:hypothetical protein